MKRFSGAGVPARRGGSYRLESLCHRKNFLEQLLMGLCPTRKA